MVPKELETLYEEIYTMTKAPLETNRYEDGSIRGRGTIGNYDVVLEADVDREHNTIEYKVVINQGEPYYEVMDIPPRSEVWKEITPEAATAVLNRVLKLEFLRRIN
jgi:hypothetical protein